MSQAIEVRQVRINWRLDRPDSRSYFFPKPVTNLPAYVGSIDLPQEFIQQSSELEMRILRDESGRIVSIILNRINE